MSKHSLEGKTALVTGGSRGIGAQIVRQLSMCGVKTAFTYNSSREKALELTGELHALGQTVKAIKCDNANAGEINAAFDEAFAELKTIDILVNNAGIAAQKLFCDITDSEWNEMLAVNLSAPFYFCRRAAKEMIRQKSGRIINISSMWGEVGASCEVHYSAAKAGLIGLTKALAKELAPSGITVNAVSPGAVNTDMLSSFSKEEIDALCAEIPLSRLGSCGEIADAVLFLASGEASYITGHVLSLNGGMFC